MSDAQERIAVPKLTKSAREVLAFIRSHPCQSSRQIALALARSRRTVQTALDFLDENEFIRTEPGNARRAHEYRLLEAGLKVLVGGAISREVPGAISQGGAIFETPTVQNPVLVGGAICASTRRSSEEKSPFPTGAYKESLITQVSVSLVSENATLLKTHSLTPQEEELIAFGEGLTGFEFDARLRARCCQLPTKFGCAAIEVIRYFVYKHLAKLKQTARRWRWTSGGALVQFAEEELARWIGGNMDGAMRKPPQVAQRNFAPEDNFGSNSFNGQLKQLAAMKGMS